MQTALVDRARRGDHEAFSVLAGGAVDRLYAIARLVLRDTELAEDATQDALAAMQAGELDVTVFQDAAGQGKGALDAALALARGEAVEQKVYVPFELVTPANIGDYLGQN